MKGHHTQNLPNCTIVRNYTALNFHVQTFGCIALVNGEVSVVKAREREREIWGCMKTHVAKIPLIRMGFQFHSN